MRHWTTVLKRRATTIMPSSGACGTGMSSVPGTIRTSNTRMARTIQRQASRRRRLARCSALSSVHTEIAMARIMRDLCQLPFAIAVRQFAAAKFGVMCMSISLRIPLLVAALCLCRRSHRLPIWKRARKSTVLAPPATVIMARGEERRIPSYCRAADQVYREPVEEFPGANPGQYSDVPLHAGARTLG